MTYFNFETTSCRFSFIIQLCNNRHKIKSNDVRRVYAFKSKITYLHDVFVTFSAFWDEFFFVIVLAIQDVFFTKHSGIPQIFVTDLTLETGALMVQTVFGLHGMIFNFFSAICTISVLTHLRLKRFYLLNIALQLWFLQLFAIWRPFLVPKPLEEPNW